MPKTPVLGLGSLKDPCSNGRLNGFFFKVEHAESAEELWKIFKYGKKLGKTQENSFPSCGSPITPWSSQNPKPEFQVPNTLLMRPSFNEEGPSISSSRTPGRLFHPSLCLLLIASHHKLNPRHFLWMVVVEVLVQYFQNLKIYVAATTHHIVVTT